MTIEIVLATYNGEKYVAAQIDSILAQDYPEWKLLVRDDASTDRTPVILVEYEQKYPERIAVLKGEKKRLGIVGNFSALLTATTAPYVMCADQDDVWLPNKINLTLAGMRELETSHGKTTPLLVHTDSTIVNERLEVIAKSFALHHKLNPFFSPFSRLLVQNTVQGCTVMVNRALLGLALPIPPVARMYDMWLAQIAAGLGHMGYIEQSTVKYRQHSANAVGTRKKMLREKVGHIQNMMEGNVTQALLFFDRFEKQLSEENRKTVKTFSKLPDYGFFKRRFILLRYNILRQPGWENLPMLMFV